MVVTWSIMSTGARMENLEFKRALGQIIARLRNDRNISQERIALEAEVDRTRLGEIERGEANPTIDTLNKIARALGQTLGSLIIEAEEMSSGILKKPVPKVNPKHINYNVPLPKGLTHVQLEQALNRAMVILDQIGLDPTQGDIQMNIYSGPSQI
jgi:transcriptional regulator with XRE-family HTH domain